MGGKGEGFSEICIKDTWTKPKGVRIKGGKWKWLGWGERWGENGDNRTSTTIKKCGNKTLYKMFSSQNSESCELDNTCCLIPQKLWPPHLAMSHLLARSLLFDGDCISQETLCSVNGVLLINSSIFAQNQRHMHVWAHWLELAVLLFMVAGQSKPTVHLYRDISCYFLNNSFIEI